MNESTFRKTRGTDPHTDGMFEAEAAGLAWLAEAGAPVVPVVSVSSSTIELPRLLSIRPDPIAARQFGAALARMHDAGAQHFGSPPPGYAGRLFIGRLPLSAVTYDTWGAFYAAERIEPYLSPAARAGNLGSADEATVRAACALIASGAFDDADRPARLHGDLWNGNVLWTPERVVMIDPAAHGGHRETDLAMLALFGCPLIDDIIAGYGEVHRLRPGATQRQPLHQMHPLAVHAVRHGPSYGAALGRAARATLALGG